jgi:hypothetical protein
MNADAMLDYTLGQLDEDRREGLEREIANDPALAASLDQLGRNLQRMLDDGQVLEPPEGLARRTLALVAERRRRPSYLDLAPVRVPFRWADLAVAASLFIACLFTLVPAMKRSRETSNMAGCTNNLRVLGLALNRYAATHKTFPSVPAGQTVPFAGTYVLQLNEAGLLPDVSVLDCPCNGTDQPPHPLPHLETLARMGPAQACQLPCLSRADYAYTLGYVKDGHPAAVPAEISDHFPLLADKPPFADSVEILEGNSPNHQGAGQNVLFRDGRVGWHPTRRIGADRDMFLNDRKLPAPGVHAWDHVLAPGITQVRGR